MPIWKTIGRTLGRITSPKLTRTVRRGEDIFRTIFTERDIFSRSQKSAPIFNKPSKWRWDYITGGSFSNPEPIINRPSRWNWRSLSTPVPIFNKPSKWKWGSTGGFSNNRASSFTRSKAANTGANFKYSGASSRPTGSFHSTRSYTYFKPEPHIPTSPPPPTEWETLAKTGELKPLTRRALRACHPDMFMQRVKGSTKILPEALPALKEEMEAEFKRLTTEVIPACNLKALNAIINKWEARWDAYK